MPHRPYSRPPRPGLVPPRHSRTEANDRRLCRLEPRASRQETACTNAKTLPGHPGRVLSPSSQSAPARTGRTGLPSSRIQAYPPLISRLLRTARIELAPAAWKAAILPLYDVRAKAVAGGEKSYFTTKLIPF